MILPCPKASTPGLNDFELPNPTHLAMHHPSQPAPLSATNHQRIADLRQLKDFDAAYNGAFGIVAYATNRFLIDHMLRVGRLLTQNDFEAMVIWGVLAHQGVAHLMPPGVLPSAILSERGRSAKDDSQIRPLRLRDISDITGIPRETARRKLAHLAQQHFVRKVSQGWVVSTERVDPDLRDFTRESVMRLLAVSDEIMAALRDADDRAATQTKPQPKAA